MESFIKWNDLVLYFLHRNTFSYPKNILTLLLLALYSSFSAADFPSSSQVLSEPESKYYEASHRKNLPSPSMHGLELNYLVYSNPPFSNLIRKPEGNFTFFGISLEILKWIARRYNFTYKLIPVDESLVEKLGTIDSVFYQLVNDESIDGACAAFFITMERKELMDFTYTAWAETIGLVVPSPEEESRLFAFVRPFKPMVWLMIFVSIIGIIAMMVFCSWYYSRFYHNKTNANSSQKNRPRFAVVDYFSFHMIYVVNILTNQGGREWSSRHSFRIVAGFWVLVSMVLVNSYSGIVISSLTVPKMKPAIESLEDLANSKDVGVLLRSDIVIGQQILSATSGIYKAVGDKARSAPGLIFTDNKLIPKLATGHYAYPYVNTFCVFFIANQYKKDGHCRFKLAKISSAPSDGYYHYPTKKGSPYAHMFNQGFMDLWESGLIRYWAKELTPMAEECFATQKREKSVKLEPIYLYDLISAFLILGIGIGLATLCFLLEIVYMGMKRYF